MSYVNSTAMLEQARKGGYAVGAFNAENMEMVRAIVCAAEKLRAPVIVQTSASAIKYGTTGTYAALVRAEAEQVSVPVCLHLDHGDTFALLVECVAKGYSSVMMDGSMLSYEDNIRVSEKAVEMASAAGVPVEAELGHVGGKATDDGTKDIYTDPAQAAEFVNRTRVSSLAVAIGTSHGFYKGMPVLDIGRLKELKAAVPVPLVMHGASGLSDDQVRESVQNGICKVNFATELRDAFSKTCLRVLSAQPDIVDPKVFLREAVSAVQEQVEARIRVCGSEGKA